MLIGAGLALPIVQELLNKYIPEKLRQLVVWALSLFCSVVYVIVKDIDTITWQALLANFAIIATIANGIFTFIIKPRR